MKAGLAVLDRVASWTGLMRLGVTRARQGLTVLMYHRVLPEARAGEYLLRNLVITREAFERQVRWLARRARVVTLREGMEMLSSGRVSGEKPVVAMTFDDGYLDNAEHAGSILDAHGLKGTFFVATGFISGTGLWFDRASRYLNDVRAGRAKAPESGEAALRLTSLDGWLGWLKSLDTVEREQVLEGVGACGMPAGCEPMTVGQLVAMARAGHEIAAHTVTHPVLTSEPIESVRRELVESKRQIEAWTGVPVVGFCYPNGSWNDEVRQACIDAGFTYATTTRRHLNMATDDALTLGRRWISPDNTTGLRGGHSTSVFAAEVLGLHDYLRDKLGRPRGPHGTPPRKRPTVVPKAA